MKKPLAIVVLSFILFFVNSCGPSTVKIPGVGDVEVGGNCHWKDEICIWNYYKSEPHPYKIYGTVLRGYYAGAANYGLSPTSEDQALKIFFYHPSCKEGCKVTNIGIDRITKSKEIELAKKYMPPLLFDKLYPNTKKTTVKKIKKKKKKTPEPPKKENQNEEESFAKLLKSYFGDRKLHSIEGLWGYRRDDEKESRIYIIFKSEDDDYLFKEVVIFHPTREFEKKISTKVIKKINEKSYEVKRTWIIKGTTFERDGIVTIVNKFKLKFHSDRYCYSNEEECLKENTVYKAKIWPPKVYADEVDITDEQSDKLKDLLTLPDN